MSQAGNSNKRNRTEVANEAKLSELSPFATAGGFTFFEPADWAVLGKVDKSSKALLASHADTFFSGQIKYFSHKIKTLPPEDNGREFFKDLYTKMTGQKPEEDLKKLFKQVYEGLIKPLALGKKLDAWRVHLTHHYDDELKGLTSPDLCEPETFLPEFKDFKPKFSRWEITIPCGGKAYNMTPLAAAASFGLDKVLQFFRQELTNPENVSWNEEILLHPHVTLEVPACCHANNEEMADEKEHNHEPQKKVVHIRNMKNFPLARPLSNNPVQFNKVYYGSHLSAHDLELYGELPPWGNRLQLKARMETKRFAEDIFFQTALFFLIKAKITLPSNVIEIFLDDDFAYMFEKGPCFFIKEIPSHESLITAFTAIARRKFLCHCATDDSLDTLSEIVVSGEYDHFGKELAPIIYRRLITALLNEGATANNTILDSPSQLPIRKIYQFVKMLGNAIRKNDFKEINEMVEKELEVYKDLDIAQWQWNIRDEDDDFFPGHDRGGWITWYVYPLTQIVKSKECFNEFNALAKLLDNARQAKPNVPTASSSTLTYVPKPS